MYIPPDHQQLFEEAERYWKLGDVYHAVKLHKRIIKLVPDWHPPYLALARIYHQRREWKPSFYYFKKTIAFLPDLREGWWCLGIAATALKKWRVARNVWSKFGLSQLPNTPEGLRLTYDGTFEILWMSAVDPARAKILSIPHPASGFRFRDEVLYERKPIGHHIVTRKRVPVYAEMGIFKRSHYRTYSCLIHDASAKQIQQLERLCYDARLGFEIWSNAARAMVIENPQAFPEYYGRSILPPEQNDASHDHALIAIAAQNQVEVLHVLDAWEVIALGQYSDLRGY